MLALPSEALPHPPLLLKTADPLLNGSEPSPRARHLNRAHLSATMLRRHESAPIAVDHRRQPCAANPPPTCHGKPIVRQDNRWFGRSITRREKRLSSMHGTTLPFHNLATMDTTTVTASRATLAPGAATTGTPAKSRCTTAPAPF